jgi:hypothetical protein
VTTTDLHGDRQMRLVHERGLRWDELIVADVMTPLTELDAIPYDLMWEDDRSWLPSLLAGRPFHRVYRFGAGDALLGETVLDPASFENLPPP